MGWKSSSEDKAAMRRTGSRSAAQRTARNEQKPERRVTCRSCNGAGRVGSEIRGHHGQVTRQICSNCNGAGQVTA